MQFKILANDTGNILVTQSQKLSMHPSRKLLLFSAIVSLLCACSPKEEACDMTGERYGKMMEEGTPLNEKDKACAQAVMIKGAEDSAKKAHAEAAAHPVGQEKQVYKKFDLYPPKK